MVDFDHMTLKNNCIFNIVMRRPRLCKIILERILGIKIAEISYPESEKGIEVDLSSRSIRLDIYCEDDNTMYNIELQNSQYEDLPRRSRYYQSLMDVGEIDKGHPYSDLRNCIIIFICTFDFRYDEKHICKFERGKECRHLYTFENVCLEDNNVKLNDGTKRIFLTTKGTMDDIPKELKNFLDYLDSGIISDEFTKELDDAVIETRSDRKWRERIMTLEDYAHAMARDAMMEHKDEWKAEGKVEAMSVLNELVKHLIDDGRLDDLKKSTEDKEYQEKLIKEYGLED